MGVNFILFFCWNTVGFLLEHPFFLKISVGTSKPIFLGLLQQK